MIWGFTGTRYGMTPAQIAAFIRLVRTRFGDAGEFHHGCCRGADSEAVDVVHVRCPKFRIVAYPGDVRGMVCPTALALSQDAYPAAPCLERNRAIVDACERLIACPYGPEETRSGTWATIRYARRALRPLLIVYGDGCTEASRGW